MNGVALVCVIVAALLFATAWEEYAEKKAGVQSSGTSLKIFTIGGVLFLFIAGSILAAT